MRSGWDGDFNQAVGLVDELETEVTKSLDQAALAGAEVLAGALQQAAPVAAEPHHGAGPGRLAASFDNVRIAESRWRKSGKYQGMARIGPMKFWGPMLEAGRSAGTSKSGHSYPAMSPKPFIHRTDRASRARMWRAIKNKLPDTDGLKLGRGRKGRR